MLDTEVCVGLGKNITCMSGDLLLGALIIECGLYIIVFITGFKIIEWLKAANRKRKK